MAECRMMINSINIFEQTNIGSMFFPSILFLLLPYTKNVLNGEDTLVNVALACMLLLIQFWEWLVFCLRSETSSIAIILRAIKLNDCCCCCCRRRRRRRCVNRIRIGENDHLSFGRSLPIIIVFHQFFCSSLFTYFSFPILSESILGSELSFHCDLIVHCQKHVTTSEPVSVCLL